MFKLDIVSIMFFWVVVGVACFDPQFIVHNPFEGVGGLLGAAYVAFVWARAQLAKSAKAPKVVPQQPASPKPRLAQERP